MPEYREEFSRLICWYSDMADAVRRGAHEMAKTLSGFSDTYSSLGIRPFVKRWANGQLLYGFTPLQQEPKREVTRTSLEGIVREVQAVSQRAA